jgi:hypothetical protein
LTPEQLNVRHNIESCRTAVLGGHLERCDSCGFERPAYNSCRDRHCPKCQWGAQLVWVKEQMERILPTQYFHVVFTLPSELRALVLGNRRVLFDLLFDAASKTLLELGRDKKRLGGTLGFTAVLHTWTRELAFHPHVHTIVTGGAYAGDEGQWLPSRGSGNYLFPVRVMSALFRGKFLAGLARAYEKGRLNFGGSCEELIDRNVFDCLKNKLYRIDWNVYAKRPFGGPEEVYRYLGRYTHRVGISNHRLTAMDEDRVTFSTKDGKSVTLKAEEFIRRFLLHVLPKGFVRIRHYGLLASGKAGSQLRAARQALDAVRVVAPPSTASDADSASEQPELSVVGDDPFRCPRCRQGAMVPCFMALPTSPLPYSRPPPMAAP